MRADLYEAYQEWRSGMLDFQDDLSWEESGKQTLLFGMLQTTMPETISTCS